MKRRQLSTFTRVLILTAFYFTGGILGDHVSFMSGEVSIIWPPAGIALGAILLFGNRFWPAVALGAVLFSFFYGMPLEFFTFGTAVGNTIGALVCAFFLERFVKFDNSLERVRDVAGFVGFGCFLGTTVNAAFNVVSMFYMGRITWEQMFPHLLQWWVPNMMAGLVVAPVILTWGTPSFIRWGPKLVAEAVLCWFGLIAATLLSFNSYLFYGVENYPLAYLPYPFLVWSSLRFGQRGATTGTLMVTALALYALLQGHGPFVALKMKESLMLIGCYIGTLATTNMLLAAAAIERKVAEMAARKSEAMFLLISENVSDLIAVTDAAGTRLYNSPYYSKVLGAPAQLAGSNAFEQIHPEDRDRVKRVFRETLETGVGQRLEYRFLLKDGSCRYIESVGNFVKGERGELDKIVSVSRDITDRKRDEESMRLLASAVRSADDSIVITTADLDKPGPQIVFVNPAFTRMTGYEQEEVVGKTPRVLQGPQTERAVLDKLRQELGHGGNFYGCAINYRKDGTEFYNEWHIEPIRDDKGATTHYLAIQRDITGRKQIEADLARARDDALTAARLKAEFLATMSHEIRTPMNGVIGMTNLLLKTSLNRQQLEFAETIRASADSLLTLINDILDFSKIEAGKLTFETLDFELRDAVEGTLELLAERAHSKGIELVSFISPNLPTLLRGDPGRLRQILTNLIGNAIKFTNQGEVVVYVSAQHDTDTHVSLEFRIKDTGIGIGQETQSRLFQPFSQADGSTTRKYGGTGLGLAISKQLVEMMHGKIGVESHLGQGSTFWFTALFEKQAARSVAPSDGKAFARVHLLIVDDNAATREILREQTAAWKLRVATAASGREALEMLRAAAAKTDPFNLAIIDMHMPDMDGATLIETIKSDRAVSDVRIILLTSMAERIASEQLKSVGVDDCVTKPARHSRLFDSIATVMLGEVKREFSPRSAPARVTGTKVPARILLAEDNTINQRVALGQLQELGYTADVAANGIEVLHALEQIPYDLILMDCQMPEMDGYESAEVIRRREKERPGSFKAKSRLHIIAMTANAMQGDRERCLAAGMDDYITKPVEVEELGAALDRWSASAPPSSEKVAPPPTPAPPPPAATAPAPALAPQPVPGPAVDLRRLRRLTQDDPAKMREMLELYLDQGESLVRDLEHAVKNQSVKDIHFMAHKLGGSSANCGMIAIVGPLRELEALGYKGQVAGSEALYQQVRNEWSRIRAFVAEYFDSAPKG